MLEIDGRLWTLTLNDQPIVHMFDADGSETFDFSEAVEVDTFDGMVLLREGDVLKFRFEGPA